MQITCHPKTTRPVDLDQELRIIEIGKALRGFRTAREAVDRMLGAGLTALEINGPEACEAVRREYKRQRACGERRAVVTTRVRWTGAPSAFDWRATFEDRVRGDHVGTGRTELEAVMNLMRKHEDAIHAAA